MISNSDNCMRWLLKRRRFVVASVQVLLIAFSLTFACLLRFDFRLPGRVVLLLLPILIAVRIAAMACFGLMHGWWRYTGISDAIDIFKAVGTGSAVFAAVVWMAWRAMVLPFSVYVLEAMLSLVLLVGVRVLSRILAERVGDQAAAKQLLLIGAGHAAQTIIRETQQVATGYSVIGCVDDDVLKQDARLLGVPVLGTTGQLSEIVAKRAVDEVIIAVPSADNKQMARFVEACKGANVPFRTVPGLTELIAGQVSLREVREISLEDLLGRKQVSFDLASVRSLIGGKSVMVTGAAGSIGSELCRQLLRYAPRLLVCADQNETGLFYLEQELSLAKTNGVAAFCVADIRDAERMRNLLVTHRVEVVFHAAAYKHVPMMEANVQEAVTNNVFGLISLLNVAQDTGCESFVMISSDKAVNPTSVMGCTKRIGELILAAWPGDGLRCVSVRFGNVLGSNGSVVPLFQEQIRQNEPITVTHPGIERFFMTIPEAVALVLQAFAVGKHGNILVLDMGKSVRILELAKTLIRLSGKSEDEVKISFTGLRPGEKLYEELFYQDERVLPTACEKVKCTRSNLLSWAELKCHLDQLGAVVSLEGAAAVRKKLKEIVPEFSFDTFEPGVAERQELPKFRQRVCDCRLGERPSIQVAGLGQAMD